MRNLKNIGIIKIIFKQKVANPQKSQPSKLSSCIVTDHMYIVVLHICIHIHLNFIGTARSSDLELCVWCYQCLLTKLLCLTAVQRTGGVRAGRRNPIVSSHTYTAIEQAITIKYKSN